MVRKKRLNWLLVADGVKAQIYTIESLTPMRIKALPAGRFRGVNKKTRDLESDRPGVSFESVGGARHAIARRSDAHRREEDKFVGRVAAKINSAAADNQFDDLIIVSPPRALAVFRKKLDAMAHRKIKREIRGEWSNLNSAKIQQHLAVRLETSK